MGNTCTGGRLQDDSYPDDITTFQAYIKEKNKHIPQTGTVRLLSYNIFIRPPMIHNNTNDWKDERLKEFTKLLHTYDIICLQEIFSSYSGRRTLLIQQAQEAGFLYHAASPKPQTLSPHFIDAGLLILSKYPIISSEFCPFPLGIGADYYVQKGGLYAKIRIGNAKLHLFTIHTQASYDSNPKYFLKRTEQVLAFQKFVKLALAKYGYHEGDVALLVGDFNVNGRDSSKLNRQLLDSDPTLQGLSGIIKSEEFNEYEALINCLTNNIDTVEDILLKAHGEHPITYGDYYLNHKNEMKPKEKVLTHPHSLCSNESLDYIFKFTPKILSDETILPLVRKSSFKQKLVIMEESAKVEKFLIRNPHFEQLSDHYGVKLSLQYIGDSETDKEDMETLSGSTC